MRQVNAKCRGERFSILLWLFVALFSTGSPVSSQSLFESSQTGEHEELVSTFLTLGGFIRSVGYLANDPEKDQKFFQSAYGQAALQLDASAGERASATADIRFRHGSEFREIVSEVEIREAYVDLWTGPAGVRFGKMISPWGKGSLFNPTNKLTPMDPTVRSPEEDDKHLGFWGMQGFTSLGSSVKMTATWKPVYQSSNLLIGPVPMPAYVNFTDPEWPGTGLKEGSYGLKFDLITPLLDASLYWFDGYHHWPGIAYDSLVPDLAAFKPRELNIHEKAYRIRMAGADLSIPVRSWIIRAEGALQVPEDDPMEQEYVPFREISYTAEIEHSGSHLNFLAGYHGKFIFDYTDPDAAASLSAGQELFTELFKPGVIPTMEEIDGMVLGRIGSFNRMYNYQMEEIYHTLFIAGSIFLFHDQVEIRLPLIHHITSGEWVIAPAVSFSPADGIEIKAGFNGLYGPAESLFDLVGPALNAGFLSLRLIF